MNHTKQNFWTKYVFATDHKVIGKQYIITGLIMALVGGYLSYVFRMQLAYPGQSIPLYGDMGPQQYNAFITLHGMIMFFWFAMPILLAGFGNLFIPLMIGTDDMAFPTVNMISFWIFFVSTIVLMVSFFLPGGAAAGGWTMYPPLSITAHQPTFWGSFFTGQTFLLLAVALEFVSMLMGGINFLTTTINKRAPGMTAFRLPIYVWFANLAGIIFMFSVGPLIAGAFMMLLDINMGTGFYDPYRGGDPILFQHLFWFFGHPEVYVLLLPSLGVTAEIISTFSRKPIFAYKTIIYMALIASVLSVIVWAHHQFISGIDPRMATFFSVGTILISIPFAAIILSYLATLWGGSIRLKMPMIWTIAGIGSFLIGGLTGLFLGSDTFDIYAHDTYFVIAHFHYVLIPVVIFGTFAAIYYWYPKYFGRMLNEKIGKIHFWLTFLSFHAFAFPLFFSGLQGEHRRIADYSSFDSLMTLPIQHIRIISTIATIILISSQLLLIINVFWSYRKGKVAGRNPWEANTLEWQTDSPPQHGNFEVYPEVYRGAYEYSLPDRTEDFYPQNEK
ncbi:MAG: cbb3-type cytochrome c oxidase subunit I [Bacteroidetes bacterium]|nr:cbb3-type cytochrome c oxidase subunit I [Bacteroidota bacterium]